MSVVQSGLVSNYDWSALIKAMMDVKSKPMLRLQEKQQGFALKLAALQSINTKLLALKDVAETMDTSNEFLVKSATSSDTDILTVTALSSAATGTHTVIVNQLAQAEIEVHSGWADMDTTSVNSSGGDRQFDYSLGSSGTISVSVADGTTLVGLRDLINNDVNNPGVHATIINDGGAVDPYHLVLTSEETGATNTVVIEATTTLDGAGGTGDFQSTTFTETQAAQDAEFRVDGYPPASWLTRETNTVSDVLEGITLTLLADDPATTVNVTISDDIEGVTAKVNDFVEAYNGLMSEIYSQINYNTDTHVGGPLLGDYTTINIKTDIQQIISSLVPGLDSSAAFDSLSQIGIESGDWGNLSVDSTKFAEALEEDFDGVGDLFADSWGSDSNDFNYFTRTAKTQGGTYAVEATWSGGAITSATIDGHTAIIDGNYIVGAEGYAEEGLRVQCTDPGDGTYNANVRVGTGVAVMASNALTFITDPYEGPVTWSEQFYEDTIADFQSQIDSMQRRLIQEEERLTAKFINLEMMISEINTTTSYFAEWAG